VNDVLKKRITDTIAKGRVMLFMKGNPSMPQCGFSAAVVGVLKEIGAPFESFNILADGEIREGLKAYSNWPTFPQLYVDGNLVGNAAAAVTTPFMFNPGALTCGANPGSPVTPDYEGPFTFTGTLHSVTLDVSGELIHDPEAELRAHLARQ